MLNHLNDEQKKRLWEQHVYSDVVFNNRLNFFLVFESVLLGVVGTLFSRPPSSAFVLVTIIILGFILTIVWGYTQARQRYIRDRIQVLLRDVLPEYRAILEDREQSQKWSFSSLMLLTYVIPSLIAFVWIVLFAYALLR